METYHGHIRTPLDAILLLEACRIGVLPRIQRRLSEKERKAIVSGSIFVWDEREAGMRRWTDGKSWSASRVSGSFLTYREMEGRRAEGTGAMADDESGASFLSSSSPTTTAAAAAATGRSARREDNTRGPVDTSTRTANDDNNNDDGVDEFRYKPDGLMKQSFSIHTTNNLKLHLICYYTKSQVLENKLIQPSQDPGLKHISIPNGLYPDASLCTFEPQNIPPQAIRQQQPPVQHRQQQQQQQLMMRPQQGLNFQYMPKYQYSVPAQFHSPPPPPQYGPVSMGYQPAFQDRHYYTSPPPTTTRMVVAPPAPPAPVPTVDVKREASYSPPSFHANNIIMARPNETSRQCSISRSSSSSSTLQDLALLSSTMNSRNSLPRSTVPPYEYDQPVSNMSSNRCANSGSGDGWNMLPPLTVNPQFNAAAATTTRYVDPRQPQLDVKGDGNKLLPGLSSIAIENAMYSGGDGYGVGGASGGKAMWGEDARAIQVLDRVFTL